MNKMLKTSAALVLMSIGTSSFAQTSREVIQGSECRARYAEKIKRKIARRQAWNDAMEKISFGCGVGVVGGGLGYTISGYFIKGVAGTIPVVLPVATGLAGLCIGLYSHFDGRKAHAPKKLLEATQIASLGSLAYSSFKSEIREENPKAEDWMIERAVAEGFDSGDFCPGNRVMRPRGMKKYVSAWVEEYLAEEAEYNQEVSELE